MYYTLVTGASSGLGAQFAQQLAAQGNNLILTARRSERLTALKTELELTGIKVEIFSADLSQQQQRDKLYQFDAAFKLNGLINNAGFGEKGLFTDLDWSRQQQMIALNISALTEICYSLLPQLKQCQQAPFIINVGSTAAFQAGPNMAIYYASKAYVVSFTEALYEELKNDAITVSCLCPGATATEFADHAKMNDTLLFKTGVMRAEKVVRIALAKRSTAIVITGLKNKLLYWASKFSPRSINRQLAGMLQK